MANNQGNPQGKKTPWSEIDMESEDVQQDLRRWGGFSGTGDDDDWATADDLVSSIVGNVLSATDQEGGDGGEAKAAQGQRQPQATKVATKRRQASDYGAWDSDGQGSGGDSMPGESERVVGQVADAQQQRQNRRAGQLTSGIALILAVITVLCAVSPFLFKQFEQNQEMWVVAIIMSLPVTAFLALPATLLGLRSATKPKGQLGKGRGIASIVISSAAVVLSSVILLSEGTSLIRGLNESGQIAKEQNLDNDTLNVVLPHATVEIDYEAASWLMRAKLLPDGTIDRGSIPISAANSKVYIGSRDVDLDLLTGGTTTGTQQPSEETYENFVKLLQDMSGGGLSMTYERNKYLVVWYDHKGIVVTPDNLIDAIKDHGRDDNEISLDFKAEEDKQDAKAAQDATERQKSKAPQDDAAQQSVPLPGEDEEGGSEELVVIDTTMAAPDEGSGASADTEGPGQVPTPVG